eukprot:1053170-Pleurochrysis_carterae.AAC.1
MKRRWRKNGGDGANGCEPGLADRRGVGGPAGGSRKRRKRANGKRVGPCCLREDREGRQKERSVDAIISGVSLIWHNASVSESPITSGDSLPYRFFHHAARARREHPISV